MHIAAQGTLLLDLAMPIRTKDTSIKASPLSFMSPSAHPDECLNVAP